MPDSEGSGGTRLIIDFTNKGGLMEWVQAARDAGLFGTGGASDVGVFTPSAVDHSRVTPEETFILARRELAREGEEVLSS